MNPARRIMLRGTLYDDVIRAQRPGVEDEGEGGLVRIVASVTNRGDAIRLLELFRPAAPDAEGMREIGEIRARAGVHRAQQAEARDQGELGGEDRQDSAVGRSGGHPGGEVVLLEFLQDPFEDVSPGPL